MDILELIYDDLKRGFDGINARLDMINGKTRTCAEKVAALEAKVELLEKAPPPTPVLDKRHTAKVAGVSAMGTAVLWEVGSLLLQKLGY